MKIRDIANKINKSPSNEDYINITKFNYDLEYEFDHIDQSRLKCYWIGNWYCTDSYVGWRMYFLDEEPVAVSTQEGRKCDEIFEWFSKELALKVKDYLISIMNKKENLFITIANMDEDIGESYDIRFNSQLLLQYNIPVLNGESVEIIEQIKELNDYGIGEKVRIKLLSGEERIININELNFKYYIKD